MFELRNKDNKLISKKMQFFLLSSLGFLLLINIPFDLTIAPSRHLMVVDMNGNPIADAMVDQIWDQYSLRKGGSQRFITNSQGKVILPKRVIPTTILSLLRGALHNFQTNAIHSSYTSHESVLVAVVVGVDNYFIFFYEGKGLRLGKVIFDPGKWSKSLEDITPEEVKKMKDDINPFFYNHSDDR